MSYNIALNHNMYGIVQENEKTMGKFRQKKKKNKKKEHWQQNSNIYVQQLETNSANLRNGTIKE